MYAAKYILSYCACVNRHPVGILVISSTLLCDLAAGVDVSSTIFQVSSHVLSFVNLGNVSRIESSTFGFGSSLWRLALVIVREEDNKGNVVWYWRSDGGFYRRFGKVEQTLEYFCGFIFWTSIGSIVNSASKSEGHVYDLLFRLCETSLLILSLLEVSDFCQALSLQKSDKTKKE